MQARLRALTKPSGRLKAIADGLAGNVVSVMDQQLDAAIDTLRVEPPPKAGSRYVRTHRYSGGWQRSDVHSSGSGFTGTLSNPMFYSVWVGGDEAGRGQQAQHADTGWTLMAVALRDAQVSGKTYRQRLHDAIRNP